MKPSELLRESIDKEEDMVIRDLLADMKNTFVEYLSEPDLCDDDMVEVKDVILKLNEILKKDIIDDDDIDFVSDYFDGDSEGEDFKESEESTEEALTERAMMRRRDISLRRQRHRSYLAKKSKVKNKMKLFRRTGKYKRYKIKSQRYSKFGRTSSGKRKTKWINNV